MAGIYERLGVRPVYSCGGVVTRYGGALMAPEVLEAMAEASKVHVVIDELQEKAGERVAELLGMEAAYISGGATAGLVVATAACMAAEDPAKINRLPDTTGMVNEVIMHRSHRNGYDFGVRQVGAKIVEIGMAGSTRVWELEAAINGNTAAILYVPVLSHRGSIPFPEVVRIARAHGVPTIVDYAAEIPPASNLRRYADMGADLVIFSGGKGLRGPQSTGLVLGRKDLIRACAANGNPNISIGRAMKAGKEDIVGMVVALELYLERISKEERGIWEGMIAHLLRELEGIPHIEASRRYPFRPGRDVPYLEVERGEGFGRTVREVIEELREGEPRIIAPSTPRGFIINPHTLPPGAEVPIARRLRQVLAG